MQNPSLNPQFFPFILLLHFLSFLILNISFKILIVQSFKIKRVYLINTKIFVLILIDILQDNMIILNIYVIIKLSNKIILNILNILNKNNKIYNNL